MATCIGQFANALPVRIPLWDSLERHDGSFRSLVTATGKNLSAVKKAELLPPVDVARAARESGRDYAPPKVAVTYSPKLANAECRLFPVEGPWDLFVCFLEYEEDIKLGVIYDPSVLSAAAVRDMKTQWGHLSALSKVDGVGLHEMLPWLPQHISVLNPGPIPSTSSNPLVHIHQWFDAHAESTPDAPALSSICKGMMTYRELYVSTEKKAHCRFQPLSLARLDAYH